MDSQDPALHPDELLAQLGWVRTLARSLVADSDVTDDLLQQVCLLALQHAPRDARAGPRLRAWLAGVTRTMARNSARTDRRRIRRERAAAQPEALPATDDIAARREALRSLMEAVTSLEEPYFSVIVECYFDGRSVAEIAAKRGSTPAAVRQQLTRARQQLRTRLHSLVADERNGWLRSALALMPAPAALKSAPAKPLSAHLGGPFMAKAVSTGKVANVFSVLIVVALFFLGGWFVLHEERHSLAPTAVLDRHLAAEVPLDESGRLFGPSTATDASPLGLTVPAVTSTDSDIAAAPVLASDSVPLEMTVVHASGLAAAGVSVALTRGETLLASGLTDRSGRVQLPAQAGEVTVFIGGVSDVPHRATLAACSGAQRIELPDGLALAGRVLVDGELPRAPFVLKIQARSPREILCPDSVYAPLSLGMLGLLHAQSFNAQVVGPGGEFLFSGLPLGWKGNCFVLRPMFRWDEGSPGLVRDFMLPLEAPATDILLRVRSSPTLLGRVVEPGSGVPVGGATIRALKTIENDQRQPTYFCTSVPEGRFEIPVPAGVGELIELTLRISHPAGRGYIERTFTHADLAASENLGDIELLPTRVLPLLVQDSDGRPVNGAFALADDASQARSERTDAYGRTDFAGLAPACHSITVWAHLFYAKQLELPPLDAALDAAHPLVVALRRSATLDVLVSRPDGTVPVGLLVALAAEEPLFADGAAMNAAPEGRSFAPHQLLVEAGMTPMSASRMTTDNSSGVPVMSGTVTFAVPADGRVTLSNLLPRVPFALSVQDAAERVRWGPESVELQAEEARVVRALVDGEAAELVVRVIDSSGRPLEGAGVEPTWPGKITGNFSATNAEGLATVKGLFASEIGLIVDLPGFVTRRLSRVSVQRGAPPLQVMLQPGRTISVFLHDAAGAGVQVQSVSAQIDGVAVGQATPFDGSNVAPSTPLGVSPPTGPSRDHSHWLIKDLPDGAVTLLVVRVEGQRIEQAHATSSPEADVLVPLLDRPTEH